MGETAAPATVSPDGRMLVFGVRESSGENRLWLLTLDDPEPRPLHGTSGGSRPFWSPDSRSLGFFAGGELRRLEIAGGPALTVAPADSGRGGTWNQDDVIVFAPSSASPLSRVNASGGEVREVTGREADSFAGSHRYPDFLPDGESFLYLELTASGAAGIDSESQQRVFLGSLNDQEPRLLMQGVSNAVYAGGHLLFLRGTSLQARPFDLGTLEFSGQATEIARGVQYDRGFERGIFSASDTTLAYHAGSFQGETEMRWYSRDGVPGSALSSVTSQGNPRISPGRAGGSFFQQRDRYAQHLAARLPA